MMEHFRNGFSLTGRALNILSREVRGMHAAAYMLGASALLSSVLALFRDRLLAHTFGAGLELDFYYAAFRIPDLLFVGIGALVSAYVLIPALAARDEKAQREYLDTVIVGFSMLVVVAGIGAAVVAPFLLRYFFPELTMGSSLDVLVHLTRILLLQPVFLGFSNVIGALTQFKHRYLLYALTPIVYNVGIIAGIVWLYPSMGLSGLVWGVVIGAALHLGIQIPSVMKDGFLRRLPRFKNPGSFLETVGISIPRALALSMNQLAFFGLLVIAGSLPIGSISIFMFAFNLQAVPLGVIGASYSVAAFPSLALLWKNGSGEFANYVATAARHILFWSMPALMLMIVLRAHVVRVVLGSGAFDWADTRLTAAALALFGISLAAQGIMLLLIRAYYASGKTYLPLFVSAGNAAATLILGVMFLKGFENVHVVTFLESLFRVEDVFGSEILALPLAYTLASIGATLTLAIHFNYHYRKFFSSVARVMAESVTAGFAGALAAYATLVVLGGITLSSTLGSVLLRGGTAGVVGLCAIALAYHLLGSKEFRETAQALKRRVWRDVEPVSSAEGAGTGVPRA